MKTMYLGEVVRQRRKALGVPLEMVCEGLCTTMTLSRFEIGRQTPSRDCVEAILQRLGLPDNRYYAQLTRREALLIRLRKEALSYCSQFEQTVGEERQQARRNGLEKIRELECCIKDDDNINRQFILGQRVTIESHSPQEQLEMLMESIRWTSPQFDPDELGKCLYSKSEVAIINKIAIRCFHSGQCGTAIDISSQLLRLVQKRTPDHAYLPLIAYNYALYLASEKRYKDVFEISALGRQICIRQGHYGMLPRFLHIDAETFYRIGDISRSAESYRAAYHIYGAAMDTRSQESLKEDAEDRFNLLF